jgi:hypothetical protein
VVHVRECVCAKTDLSLHCGRCHHATSSARIQVHPSDCHHTWHTKKSRINCLLCASRATVPGMDCYYCCCCYRCNPLSRLLAEFRSLPACPEIRTSHSNCVLEMDVGRERRRALERSIGGNPTMSMKLNAPMYLSMAWTCAYVGPL